MKKLFFIALFVASLTATAQVKPITAAELDYRKDGNGSFLLVLRRGQPLIASLTAFMEKERLPGASMSGLGAVENVEIAYYDIAKQKYKYQKFTPSMEVLSLNDNLGTFEGQPIVHAHVALADSNYVVRGGHVKEAVVSLILEIMITPTTKPITREWNKEFAELRTITKVKKE